MSSDTYAMSRAGRRCTYERMKRIMVEKGRQCRRQDFWSLVAWSEEGLAGCVEQIGRRKSKFDLEPGGRECV